ncbi:MFS transporter [Candidatus Nitrotoga fabula]|uniref:Vibrioferrin membrane-spanning transport protein PvsC n=1 Tax=Candidatus Nitrotoga fabula TaxID=2182327 RepID=A0A916BBU8_9PROT|nr:MFS transporter [Candidatus Nitrotoga fabula]CAE6709286.1 Vibrioferrin membrane-spanning transport protein PvsC [Candidatus Nitrotoga fabula]
MKNKQGIIVAIIMSAHFVAAFAALGMPPFFGLILDKSLHSEAHYLAGWLYVLPIFFTAISSPWWGRLADRYGKKRLLLRAQLGLAGSFLLAGFAPNTIIFSLALSLQGLLGGTFAASNAYLATVVSGPDLNRSLTLMQWSARAALVTAPAILGLLMVVESPLELYRYLAILPLISALLIVFLPVFPEQPKKIKIAEKIKGIKTVTFQQIHFLQFVFIFSTVITFPYFIQLVKTYSDGDSIALAGFLFGLPHLVYLLFAIPLSRYLGHRKLIYMMSISFLLLGVSLFAQVIFSSLSAVIIWRIIMGINMTIGFVGLHMLIAEVVNSGNAGRTFGWFESNSKWASVIAGLIAGTSVQLYDLRAPFLIGGFTLGITGLYLTVLVICRLRPNNS